MVLKLEDSQHAVLKAPLTISSKKVDEFLQSKMNWLHKNAAKLAEKENFSSSFDLENTIYLNGQPFMPAKEVSLNYSLQSAEKQRQLRKKIYLSNFHTLEELAERLSQRTGLVYKELKPTTSTRVWGSYNVKGTMKLNWKLVILPQRLAEYVVCHELCHSRHMNHKPKFWADVQKICPNYRALKKELEDYSFVLKNEV